MSDAQRLFRVLTLLLAVVEQAAATIEESDQPDEDLRAALLDLSERLYAVLGSDRFRAPH